MFYNLFHQWLRLQIHSNSLTYFHGHGISNNYSLEFWLRDGYKGWDIHRSEYLGHKAGAIEIPPPTKIERNSQISEGSSGAASSFNSDDSGMLVSFFAHDWRVEQRSQRLQDSTREPSEFTTTEAVDETTEEPTYELEQFEISDELDGINLSDDPTPCR